MKSQKIFLALGVFFLFGILVGIDEKNIGMILGYIIMSMIFLFLSKDYMFIMIRKFKNQLTDEDKLILEQDILRIQKQKEQKQKISMKQLEIKNQQKCQNKVNNLNSIKETSVSTLERIQQNKRDGIACCPRCGSTSITANKKGYGIGKGVIGAAVVGPIGLIAGNAGAKKVLVTCLNCGKQFKPGK